MEQRYGQLLGSEGFLANLREIHGDTPNLDFQLNRFEALVSKHLEDCPETKIQELRLYSTSGRTELAGNHTDHNLGKVIAASINLDTIAVVHSSPDSITRVISEGFPAVTVDLSDTSVVEAEKGTTHALVRGIAAAFKQRGLQAGGFTAHTSTRVLKGSGLSSSAAIEVLIATILNDLYNENALTPVELALCGKFAENVYFGKPSGLMDQLACAHGGIIGIDFADPANPATTPIWYDFKKAGYDLIVVDTGGNHADLTADYAAIPQEMQSIASWFGKQHMRSVGISEFMSALPQIRASLKNDRAVLRALHFLQENSRVDAMLESLLHEDVETYLQLVRESGRSSLMLLQNLYSLHTAHEQGLVVALALTEQFLGNSGACRVHGGGFAGTIQVYVPMEKSDEYRQFIERIFGAGSATTLSVRAKSSSRIG